MSHRLFLSVLCWCVLSKWEESGCKALTLNSVILHHISGGGAGVYQRRRRRSWVWNQFFVLEEYTGDEPLYIGKVQKITQLIDFLRISVQKYKKFLCPCTALYVGCRIVLIYLNLRYFSLFDYFQ